MGIQGFALMYLLECIVEIIDLSLSVGKLDAEFLVDLLGFGELVAEFLVDFFETRDCAI